MAANKPKLLFAAVGLQPGTGGTAELSRQAAAALLDMQRSGLLNLQIFVLAGRATPNDDDFLHRADCNIRWFDGNRLAFAFALLVSRVDVRLLDHVGLARILGLIPKPLRPLYLLFVHGVELWGGERADYVRTARRADLLIANSEFTAGRIRSRHNALPEIKVCWPGKDRVLSGSDQQSWQVPHLGPHALLIVGRLSSEQRHKGHDHLIEAMPQILRAVPDARLIIAGSGDDSERLEQKARDCGAGDSVVFTGWVDEEQLHWLYEECALFAMPSEGDGFGIVFLEAMMHGKPCVGLKTGSAAEVFEDGMSGILVDRDDRKDMAERLAVLLLDEERRIRIGQLARDRYLALFQGKHYSQRLQVILANYLKGQALVRERVGGELQ